MAVGEGRAVEGAKHAFGQFRKSPVQFMLAVFLVMCCGATKKLQTFPMPWIAGGSKCVKEVSSAPAQSSDFTIENITYTPTTWLKRDSDCTEKAKVFLFVTESFTITTAYLVFFGLTKAIFNFITGVCCDRFGRKWTLTVGWALAIPMPLMVIFAESWWTAAFSNVFLGMQQALVWSATIFIMVDYLGQRNSGIAIGLNETIGYTTIAIVTTIAAAMLDEDEPRTTCYYVVIGLIVVNFVVGATVLKDSKPVAVKEEAEITKREEDDVSTNTGTELTWPSGRKSVISVGRSAFVYTSFVNTSLMSICFAGLMINFISGFAWGLFAKWMKNDYEVDGELQWEALGKTAVANVTLCYGMPKGLLQWFFGFLGDRIGRKKLIVLGLSMCALGLVILAAVGETAENPYAGFAVGAFFLGSGTGVMYTNNLAAVCDHSDPSWRSSALGSYRFWRDMGYAVGALLTGLFADAMGIFGSVLLTAALTVAAATCVGLLYTEVKPDSGKGEESEAAAC